MRRPSPPQPLVPPPGPEPPPSDRESPARTPRTYIHTCIHPCMDAYTQTDRHMHIYQLRLLLDECMVPTNIHTCVCTYVQICLSPSSMMERIPSRHRNQGQSNPANSAHMSGLGRGPPCGASFGTRLSERPALALSVSLQAGGLRAIRGEDEN